MTIKNVMMPLADRNTCKSELLPKYNKIITLTTMIRLHVFYLSHHSMLSKQIKCKKLDLNHLAR